MEAPYHEIDFERLADRGFAVIPSFLSPGEVEALQRDFASQEIAPNSNYDLVFPADPAVHALREKLDLVAEEISKASEIRCSYSGLHHAYYFASEILNFGSWHQDNESYYAVQNHYDYLNFWIPVVKPRVDKGNLEMIPMDALRVEAPDQWEKLVGGGGTTFVRGRDETLIYGDSGVLVSLPFDIADLRTTPHTEAGDLVVLRGDVIHRTQDVETKRVALSVRLTNPYGELHRRELARGGFRKTRMLARSWEDFGPLFEAFEHSGREVLSWREVQQAQDGPGGQLRKFTPAQAFRFILAQKLRNGVVWDSVAATLGNAWANLRAQKLRRQR